MYGEYQQSFMARECREVCLLGQDCLSCPIPDCDHGFTIHRIRAVLVRNELRQFIPFCIVGGIGFVIDAGILSLLVHGFKLDPLVSRLVSFPSALTATWYLNRRVTFSHAVSNNPRQEWLRYALVSVAGSLLNFMVYLACIRLSQTMYSYPETALGIAAIVALAFNYLGSSRYVFSQDLDN